MTVRYTVLVLVVLLVSAGVIVRVYDVGGRDDRGSAVGADVAHAGAKHKRPPPPYATAPAHLVGVGDERRERDVARVHDLRQARTTQHLVREHGEVARA